MAIQKAEELAKEIVCSHFMVIEINGCADLIRTDRRAVIEKCKKAWINRAELLFIKSDSATRENVRAIAANEANNLFDSLLRELD